MKQFSWTLIVFYNVFQFVESYTTVVQGSLICSKSHRSEKLPKIKICIMFRWRERVGVKKVCTMHKKPNGVSYMWILKYLAIVNGERLFSWSRIEWKVYLSAFQHFHVLFYALNCSDENTKLDSLSSIEF